MSSALLPCPSLLPIDDNHRAPPCEQRGENSQRHCIQDSFRITSPLHLRRRRWPPGLPSFGPATGVARLSGSPERLLERAVRNAAFCFFFWRSTKPKRKESGGQRGRGRGR